MSKLCDNQTMDYYLDCKEMSQQTRRYGERTLRAGYQVRRTGLNRLHSVFTTLQCPGPSRPMEPVKAKSNGFWNLKGVERQSTEDSWECEGPL